MRKSSLFFPITGKKLTVDSSVVVGEVGAAVVRDWTVRQVAVAVVGWRARYHRRAILQTQRRQKNLGTNFFAMKGINLL